MPPSHASWCLTSGYICVPINVIQDVTLRWLPGQPNKVLENLPLKNHLFIHPFIEQILPWCLDLVLEHNGRAQCELLVLLTARSLGQHHWWITLLFLGDPWCWQPPQTPPSSVLEWPRDPRLDIPPSQTLVLGSCSASAWGLVGRKTASGNAFQMSTRWRYLCNLIACNIDRVERGRE